jgi:Uncharacterized protein conserved in bacteria (DUF2059)
MPPVGALPVWKLPMPLPALRLIPAALCLALTVPALPLLAQTDPVTTQTTPVTAADLSRILMIPEIIGVMREEGLAYGQSLEDEMFPGSGGAGWDTTVALIYDQATMVARFQAAFAQEAEGDPRAMADIVGFFDTELGQRILRLEIEARRSLMDEAVEEAAQQRAAEMVAQDDPRMAALRDFALANDLIESNVQGALNANLGFYQGMTEAGAFGAEMTEDQILSDVWGQEPQIRTETEEWLYPFLALAYGPLTDAELQSYTAFSRTASGKRMNVALFAAFDAVFVQISRDLGRATAKQMIGKDI